MTDISTEYRRLVLSGAEIAKLTGWSSKMVSDYLGIYDDALVVATYVSSNTDDIDSLEADVASIEADISAIEGFLESFTEGSVLFANSDGEPSEDNGNFFWDNTDKILKIVGKILNDQNSDEIGIEIDSEATTLTNYGLKVVTGQGAGGMLVAYGASGNGDFYAALPPNGGNAASFLFIRDLASANTDCAVTRIHQDNAGDDQAALEVQQDGTGYAATLGDGTNETRVKADGEINLVGTARVKKEFTVPLSDFNPGASGPTAATQGIFPSYEFTINDDMHTSFEVPSDCDTSEDITVEIYWGINEDYATNSAEVQWSCAWRAVAVGEDITAGGSSGTIDFGDVDIPASANTLVKTTGTIAAASVSQDDLIALNGARVALDGGNNPAAEPYIVMVNIEYTSNKLGEAT